MMDNRMRLSTRLLLCLASLLLFQIGSTLADNCMANTTCNTCTRCRGVQQCYVLTGTSQVDLTCDRSSENASWYRINEAGNNNTITRGSAKYGGGSNRLVIKDVVGADEGLYECEEGGTVETAGCVFVLGRGNFATCSSGDCDVQDISVLAGDTIVFDTRVIFTESGPCGLPQNTGFFQLFKGNYLVGENIVYNCLGTNDPCPANSTNGVYAIHGGGHRFNMNLTIQNATMDDGGNYTFRVQLQSGEGSREPLITFRVTVNPNTPDTSNSTTSTTEVSTPTNGASIPATATGFIITSFTATAILLTDFLV